MSETEANRALVQAAFDRWRAGTGTPFELLAPDASWTIAGSSSPRSKTYGLKELQDQVLSPLAARLERPLAPSVRGIWADGDAVIVLFDAEAPARGGGAYRNTYTWHFRMSGGRVASALAFFDVHHLDEFLAR
ncbi:MAG TPA: nuclear transport factor 2 family protein [Myxococcota bacterium]|nr:nuclear transport factor 2 family protein [Myxococcota bacterium]